MTTSLKRNRRELAAAALAIGATPHARWVWFAGFAAASIPELGTPDARRRVAEVEAFSLGAVEAAGGALQFYQAPSEANLADIQRTAKDVIRHITGSRGGWLWFPPSEVQLGIYATPTSTAERGELTLATMVKTQTAVDLFRAAVLDLLPRLRGSLRLCPAPECGRPFVAGRSHQRFCSPRCQGKAGLARFIERQGGKEGFAEKRSEAYYARKEKALGKIKRRRVRSR